MHTRIYERLIELARQKKLTTNGESAPLAVLSMDHDADCDKMSTILEEIARHEEDEGRPVLTALVVHRGNDNNPGEGFFSIAKKFGRFNGSREPTERLKFWNDQVKKVHSYWRGR